MLRVILPLSLPTTAMKALTTVLPHDPDFPSHWLRAAPALHCAYLLLMLTSSPHHHPPISQTRRLRSREK